MFIRDYTLRFVKSERGQTMIFVGMGLLMLLGFLGLAIDVGRAYLVKAQLSKALDAAVLAGGQSGDNNNEVIEKIIKKSFKANFRPSYMGASEVSPEPPPGGGFVSRDKTSEGIPVRVISATATTTLPTTFMRVLGLNELTVRASASVQRKLLDLIIALDISNSIGETDLGFLKIAAKNLVGMFNQSVDRVGLLTFAIDVVWRVRLRKEPGFDKREIEQQINNISLDGWTAGGPALAEAWQELSVEPPRPVGNRCIPARPYDPRSDPDRWRVIVYFTDGAPNIIRSDFTFKDCYDEFLGRFPDHTIGDDDEITRCGAHISASEDDSLNEPLRMDGLFRPVSTITQRLKHYERFGFSEPPDGAIFINQPLGGCWDVRNRFNIGPGNGFLRLRLRDYYGVSLESVTGVTASKRKLCRGENCSEGFIQIPGRFGPGDQGGKDFRKVVNGMARNELENVADAARAEGITIFTIGLDGVGELSARSLEWDLERGGETGEDILRRIANVKDDNPEYNDKQPSGMYAYARTGDDLNRAFNKIGGLILRLTR